MDFALIIVCLAVIAILGVLVLNSKIGLNDLQVSYLITGLAFGSMLFLAIAYDAHPECDSMINHNNLTLQMLQENCYQYIDF